LFFSNDFKATVLTVQLHQFNAKKKKKKKNEFLDKTTATFALFYSLLQRRPFPTSILFITLSEAPFVLSHSLNKPHDRESNPDSRLI
jgi:hypothetical protein